MGLASLKLVKLSKLNSSRSSQETLTSLILCSRTSVLTATTSSLRESKPLLRLKLSLQRKPSQSLTQFLKILVLRKWKNRRSWKQFNWLKNNSPQKLLKMRKTIKSWLNSWLLKRPPELLLSWKNSKACLKWLIKTADQLLHWKKSLLSKLA